MTETLDELRQWLDETGIPRSVPRFVECVAIVQNAVPEQYNFMAEHPNELAHYMLLYENYDGYRKACFFPQRNGPYVPPLVPGGRHPAHWTQQDVATLYSILGQQSLWCRKRVLNFDEVEVPRHKRIVHCPDFLLTWAGNPHMTLRNVLEDAPWIPVEDGDWRKHEGVIEWTRSLMDWLKISGKRFPGTWSGRV